MHYPSYNKYFVLKTRVFGFFPNSVSRGYFRSLVMGSSSSLKVPGNVYVTVMELEDFGGGGGDNRESVQYNL